MLPQQFWREIQGTVIDGEFRVGELLRAEREGLFAAEPLAPASFPTPVTVRFMRATPEPVLERYLEAVFFTHPNVLRCYRAGTCEIAGTPFIYALLERADGTLADLESEGPLSIDAARDLGRQLIDGLGWLHAQNLVYCNLDPTTVVRSGDVWKLSEYSQLRLAGNDYSNETRRLLALSPGTPPEAWDGIVSPAWDAWSLAWLLCGAVEERRTGPRDAAGARSSRRRSAQPFAGLIPECLNANVGERCGLQRIGEILNGAPAATRPAVVPESEPAPIALAEPSRDPISYKRHSTFSPRSALMTALAFAAGFIVFATLAWHPRHTSGAAVTTPPQTTAPSPEKTIVAPALPASKPVGEADRTAVDMHTPKGLLEQWASAIRSGDPDRQAACYGSNVYAFYGDSDLTPEQIRQRREHMVAQLGKAHRFDISNVDVQMKTASSAVVTFDESWDFRGKTASSGRMKERLGMRKTAAGWRITSESNTHTYYKNGPNPQS